MSEFDEWLENEAELYRMDEMPRGSEMLLKIKAHIAQLEAENAALSASLINANDDLAKAQRAVEVVAAMSEWIDKSNGHGVEIERYDCKDDPIHVSFMKYNGCTTVESSDGPDLATAVLAAKEGLS